MNKQDAGALPPIAGVQGVGNTPKKLDRVLSFTTPCFLHQSPGKKEQSSPVPTSAFDYDDHKVKAKRNPNLHGSFTVTSQMAPRGYKCNNNGTVTNDNNIKGRHRAMDDIQIPHILVSIKEEDDAKPRSGSAPAGGSTQSWGATGGSAKRCTFLDDKGGLSPVMKRKGKDGKMRDVSTSSVLGPVVYNKLKAAEHLKVPSPKLKKKREEVEEDVDENVDALTKHFATQLSPEGQLATLKGYEDILERTIRRKYCPALKRRITPVLVPLQRSTVSTYVKDVTASDLDLGNGSLNMRMHTAIQLLDKVKPRLSKQEAIRTVNPKHIVKSFDQWTEDWRSELTTSPASS